MSNVTPQKTFIVTAFNVIKPFIEFFNSSCNSIYVLPTNGLQVEIFTYSPSIDSTI